MREITPYCLQQTKNIFKNFTGSIKIFLMLFVLGSFFIPAKVFAQVINVDGNPADWSAFPSVRVGDQFNVVGADNIFATNQKDFQCASDWLWKLGTAKDKNDIANGAAMLTSDVDTGSGGTLTHLHGSFLVFAGDRISNSGDAQIGFWFFQNGTAPAVVSGQNIFDPPKTPGDILVLADFTGGGRTGTVTVLKWVGADCVHPTEAVNFTSSGASAAVAENNGGSAALPTGWVFIDKGTGLPQYATNEFYEGYVDLATLFPNQTFCPSTF